LPQNSSKIDFNQPLASQFRGPFTGFVIHIKDGWCHAYANQTGDTSVFFIQNEKYSIISSDYNLLFNTCNIHLTFNSLAAQQMLSLGYLVEDVTFAREINRLLPGQLLLFQPGRAFSFSNYHRFDNTNSLEISIDEAVEKLDLSFRHAVKRCFDKDLEYGYNHHLADLSGGLDSRMTTWVAKELGYKNITNLCYTKAGVKESQYAAWTATRLKNEFIFQQLDDLNFLHDNEEIVRLNHGFGFYAGITGGNRLLKSLNFDHFGLEHTGQIGDVIVGTFLSKATLSKTWNPQDICYSDQVKAPIAHTKEYPNDELSMLYYRAFQGALSTHFIRRKYTEVVSPFLDVDFITLCLSLPLEFRVGHKLYARWIELKYPEILEIPSTRALPGHTGGQKQKLQRLLHPSLKKGLVIMLRKLGVLEYARQYQAMNPFNLWYSQDTEL
ncbi:MAG TPA: asparagine synthase-related protein, partial [Bacteroidales bacterium]|nr:asparagine synthase-related protein [Bacteroidales bacterium]